MCLCDILRILIAGIRNLGTCPCPCCLIPLNRVHNLGMARDMGQRRTLACVDNVNRRGKIIAARRVIFEKKTQINSTAVNSILQNESLVPNVVCTKSLNIIGFFWPKRISTECILRLTVAIWVQFIQDVGSRFNARVRVGCMEGYIYSPSTHSSINR